MGRPKRLYDDTVAALLTGALTLDDESCWIWTRSLDSKGYGVFHAFGEHRAHRASFVYHCMNGLPIPDGMFVCHRCDRPSCINPKHLFLGTPGDNSADMASKGRAVGAPPGEAHHNAKLTNATVGIIRERAKDGATHTALAREFGISRPQISRIVRGLKWKVTPEPPR